MIVHPIRQALDHGERPDPARGIFETILLTDGRAPLLEAHLRRLAGSARELYGLELPPMPDTGVAAPAAAGPAAAAGTSGRLRVTFVPGERLTVERGPRPVNPTYNAIAPFLLPGGLGPHKWADRRLADAISSAAGPAALPLLLDADGSVLESTRMNVLIEEQGRLVSPPSDGRYRAGFGRTRLRYDEEPVDLDRLLAADALVLTSALRVIRLPRTA